MWASKKQMRFSMNLFLHTSVCTWRRPVMCGLLPGQVQIPRGNQKRLWQLNVQQCLHPPRYPHSIAEKKIFWGIRLTCSDMWNFNQLRRQQKIGFLKFLTKSTLALISYKYMYSTLQIYILAPSNDDQIFFPGKFCFS